MRRVSGMRTRQTRLAVVDDCEEEQIVDLRDMVVCKVLLASGIWFVLLPVLVAVWIYAQLHPLNGNSGGGAWFSVVFDRGDVVGTTGALDRDVDIHAPEIHLRGCQPARLI
jgi:hypothetical protein